MEFTTRDQATFVILGIFILLTFYVTRGKGILDICCQFLKLFKFIIMWVQILFLFLFLYLGYCFNQNLIMWTVFFMIPYMFFCSDIINTNLSTYKKRIFSIVSGSLIIDIIVSAKTFSLWIEVVLQFSFIFLMLIILTAKKMKYGEVVKILDNINIFTNLVVICIILFSSSFRDYQTSFVTTLFTLFISLLLYVLGYLLNVLYRYKDISDFILMFSNEKLSWFELWRIFQIFHINIDRIQSFRQKVSRNLYLLDELDRIEKILKYDETKILGRANIM